MVTTNILRQILRPRASVFWRILTSHITRDKDTIRQLFRVHWYVFPKKSYAQLKRYTLFQSIWFSRVVHKRVPTCLS